MCRRRSLEELESRCLLACAAGTEPWLVSTTELSVDFAETSLLPGARLRVGIGDHMAGGPTTSTVVAGISPQETMVGSLALDNGRYLVGWAGTHLDTFGVYIREFNASGHPVSDPLLVQPLPVPSTLGPVHLSLAATAADQFAVLWQDGGQIYGQAFNCAMESIGTITTLAADAAEGASELQAISVHEQGLVFSWMTYSGQRVVQPVDASLQASHPPIYLPVETGWSSLFQLLAHPTAGFAVSYDAYSSSGEDLHHVQPYALDGSLEGTGLRYPHALTEPRVVTYLADGNIASLYPLPHPSTVGMDIALEIHSPVGDPLVAQTIVQDASLADAAQIVALHHGGFAVAFARGTSAPQQLAVQQFNAMGETVGSEIAINSQPIPSPVKYQLAPLAQGGFTLQWAGFTLDGRGLTLDTQPHHAGVTPLSIELLGIPELDAFAEIQLAGIPGHAALNRGTRDEAGIWHLHGTDLATLAILSETDLGTLQLSLRIANPETLVAYGELHTTLGTDQADRLTSLQYHLINGGDGIDTLVLPGLYEEYTVAPMGVGFQVLTTLGEVVHSQVLGVEVVEFANGTVASETWLQSTDESPDDPSTVLSATEDPVTDHSNEEGAESVGPVDDGVIESLEDFHLLEALNARFEEDIWESDFHGWEELWDEIEDARVERDDEDEEEREPPELLDDVVEPPSESPEAMFGNGGETVAVGEASEAPATPAAAESLLAGFDHEGQSGPMDRSVPLPPQPTAVPPPAPRQAFTTRHVPFRLATQTTTFPVRTEAVTQLQVQPTSAEDATSGLFASTTLGIPCVFDSDQLFERVEEADEESDQVTQQQRLIVGTAIVFAAGFSLAQVVWALRATILVTKMMSTIPVWVGFDPLPLLTPHDKERNEQDQETLMDIASATMTT